MTESAERKARLQANLYKANRKRERLELELEADTKAYDAAAGNGAERRRLARAKNRSARALAFNRRWMKQLQEKIEDLS